jgi:hypothetical protein
MRHPSFAQSLSVQTATRFSASACKLIASDNNFVFAVAPTEPQCLAVLIAAYALQNNEPAKTLADTID